jgi:hypothetical protein
MSYIIAAKFNPNDEIQNVQREINMDFYFVGITF